MSTYYAHTGLRADRSDWQLLRDHLAKVAQFAESFARDACPGNEALIAAAKLAGLLHDLGKYRVGFQTMLSCRFQNLPLPIPREQTFHKQAGAVKAATFGQIPVAFAISGHHGGMPDKIDLKNMVAPLLGEPETATVFESASRDCSAIAALSIAKPNCLSDGAAEFASRVVFSCLVDADWTDTSRHERSTKGLPPDLPPPALAAQERLGRLLGYIDERSRTCPDATMANLRADVLNACLTAAESKPGVFSLSVPTGGGKTLSGMAFALRHAETHDLRRVIYVAPYLSIIEQNAAVIRDALGLARSDPDLFEHHSLSEPFAGDDEEETINEAAIRRAENWDSPLVVTTNVQFFESLFSNQPSRSRKLHNVGRSVVLLDECQSLPPGLVAPTCGMLRQIAEQLGATIVLCTATQPAFDHERLQETERLRAREIIPQRLNLFARLKRVQMAWPAPDEKLTWTQVTERMVAESTGRRRAALCVVNTRRAAREVFAELQRLADAAALHLSTSMCPAHRLEVLQAVKGRLGSGKSCFLVSTQLIEAGVDIDFPFVMRELAPLESVIQAAGRCNREGLIKEAGGRVVVFRSVDGALPLDSWYRAGTAILEQNFLAQHRHPRIDEPVDIQTYFTRLFHSGDLDAHDIQSKRFNAQFREVARSYSLIDDGGVPVVVATWKEREQEIRSLLDRLRSDPSRANFRRLAPFQVNLRRHELTRFQPFVEPLDENIDLLIWHGAYDQQRGIAENAADQLLCV